jgi:hypothetical protein
MTLVIDLKRGLREPEYRAELCEELEGGVSDMVMEESAARIDALEKALRRLVTAEEDGCLCSEMEMATAIDEARAALGEGE